MNKLLPIVFSAMFFLTACGGGSKTDDSSKQDDPTGIIDDDNDSIADDIDNCPNIPNADQLDTDGDGMGDVCDTNDDVTPKDACSDGIDNDNDGLTDFPDDPGCASITDDNEYNAPVSSGETPIIGSVSGSIVDGQQITISGSNFGANGPNVILFDDFKRGVVGEEVSLNATVGDWSIKGHHPIYKEDSRGNISGRLVGEIGRLTAVFDDTQEIFVSYRVMIPSGKHFPYSFAPNTFAIGSNWKLVWLRDGIRGGNGNDDLCLPTFGTTNYSSIAGNDNAYKLTTGRVTGDTRWFSFQDWNRFSVYLKGGERPTVDPGTVWAQGMSPEFGQKTFGSNDRRIFDGDDTPDGYKFEDDAISRWNHLGVVGWHRGGDDNAAANYDDIYIATGAHARARIEIGNNPIYEDSTVLAIATPTSWQDNAITTTLRQGAFQNGETAYLFVIDENGKASNGYPFVVGSTIP